MSKMVIRFFTIADFEEEEIWLREQHQHGLKLVNMVPPCFYYFEECESEDVVYRLDFKNAYPDSEYTTLFADYGWEYVGKCFGWIYFRKPASQMESDEDSEIFSDCESRISMLENIIKRRMMPILVIFLCCCLPSLFRAMDSVTGMAFKTFWIIMTVMYVYLITHCTAKLFVLKKKYEK